VREGGFYAGSGHSPWGQLQGDPIFSPERGLGRACRGSCVLFELLRLSAFIPVLVPLGTIHTGHVPPLPRHPPPLAPLPPAPPPVVQIPAGRRSVLDAYGEIILRGWREALGACQPEIENSLIQVRGHRHTLADIDRWAYRYPSPPVSHPQAAWAASTVLPVTCTHLNLKVGLISGQLTTHILSNQKRESSAFLASTAALGPSPACSECIRAITLADTDRWAHGPPVTPPHTALSCLSHTHT